MNFSFKASHAFMNCRLDSKDSVFASWKMHVFIKYDKNALSTYFCFKMEKHLKNSLQFFDIKDRKVFAKS